MKDVSAKIGWSFIFVGAMFTTLIVSRYFTFDPEVYFPEQRAIYLDHRIGLYGHILGGMIAMFVGPFQFIRGLRRRFPGLHRWSGRLYISGCLLGGVCGLFMAQFAYGGFPSGAGFASLGVLWIACTLTALGRILGGNVPAHREWMIRSYALTLAAFSLRIQLLLHGILLGSGVIDVPYVSAYTAVAWSCWVPNLILAEYYINRTRDTSSVPQDAIGV